MRRRMFDIVFVLSVCGLRRLEAFGADIVSFSRVKTKIASHTMEDMKKQIAPKPQNL